MTRHFVNSPALAALLPPAFVTLCLRMGALTVPQAITLAERVAAHPGDSAETGLSAQEALDLRTLLIGIQRDILAGSAPPPAEPPPLGHIGGYVPPDPTRADDRTPSLFDPPAPETDPAAPENERGDDPADREEEQR